jgi:glucose-1-phosphate adenylyltransferase
VLQAHAPDVVAVFAADHVYRMDVRQMAAFHRERDADATVGAVAVPIAQASSFGIMGTDADGRIREFREKPRHPAPIPGHPSQAYASMGNYLFRPSVLSAALNEARSRGDTDLGRAVRPRLCGKARDYAYAFRRNVVPGVQDFEEPAYWRDVGTLSALAAAQQDAMGNRPRFNLWNSRWPIRGEFEAALHGRRRDWSGAEDSLPPLKPSAAVLAAGRDLRSDERVQTS